MVGKTHLMELNCVLPVVYESADAPGTGTCLFTTFAFGKSGKYGHICWEDGRQVRKGAKMMSSLSSVGGAEVSTPPLRRAQHKEFEYKQQQERGCLGGRTYVKIEDEGEEESPCAMPGPRKQSKVEHEQKAGHVGQVAAATLDKRTVDDLCAQVSCAARAAVQQGVEPNLGSQEAQFVRLGKEKDGLQQRVDHLQSCVDVLQEAAAQAKAETAGLQMDVVRLTEKHTAAIGTWQCSTGAGAGSGRRDPAVAAGGPSWW